MPNGISTALSRILRKAHNRSVSRGFRANAGVNGRRLHGGISLHRWFKKASAQLPPANLRRLSRRFVWFAAGLGLFTAVLSSVAPRSILAGAQLQPDKRAALTGVAAPANDYLGSQACFVCHSDIFKTFSQTSMGRSMSTVTPEFVARLSLPAKFDDSKSDRHFEVFAR